MLRQRSLLKKAMKKSIPEKCPTPDWGVAEPPVEVLADFPLEMLENTPVSLDITDYIFSNISAGSIKLMLDGTAQTTTTRYYFYIHSLENIIDFDYAPQLVFSNGGSSIDNVDNTINETVVSTQYYTLQGVEIAQPTQNSIYIVKTVYQSGNSSSKVVYISK